MIRRLNVANICIRYLLFGSCVVLLFVFVLTPAVTGEKDETSFSTTAVL